MGLRDELHRLRREAEGGLISIPQRDGTVRRFPESDLAAAFLNALDRERGEDVPEHPLSSAARNSPDPQWRDSVLVGPEEVPAPPEDLSE